MLFGLHQQTFLQTNYFCGMLFLTLYLLNLFLDDWDTSVFNYLEKIKSDPHSISYILNESIINLGIIKLAKCNCNIDYNENNKLYSVGFLGCWFHYINLNKHYL